MHSPLDLGKPDLHLVERLAVGGGVWIVTPGARRLRRPPPRFYGYSLGPLLPTLNSSTLVLRGVRGE